MRYASSMLAARSRSSQRHDAIAERYFVQFVGFSLHDCEVHSSVATGNKSEALSAGDYLLRLCRPRVVDIELDMVAGKRRAPRRPALWRTKAVPRTLRNHGHLR